MFNKLKNMKVQKKLKSCFFMILAMSSIACILGIAAIMFTNNEYKAALVENGFSQGEIGIYNTYLNKNAALARDAFVVSDQTEREKIVEEFDSLIDKTNEALENLKKHCQTPQELEYINQIDEIYPKYIEARKSVTELAKTNHNPEEVIMAYREQALPYLNEVMDATDNLTQLNVELGNKASKFLSMQTYVIALIMIAVLLITCLVCWKFSSFVADLFAKPIIKVKDAAAQMAEGCLDIELDKMYEDEIGDMTESYQSAANTLKVYIKDLSDNLSKMASGDFNINTEVEYKGDFKVLEEAMDTIATSLSDTLSNIGEVSSQVAVGATQMADSSQSLAEGATDQAGSVQELTATIHNMAGIVEDNAKGADEAYVSAKDFEQKAAASNEEISQLNTAMERINSTSNEIANIIAEIEDIAAQTNLLALNASIEAARAGEAGKGFAVVADQIGRLASDSANSAVNTKKLIGNAVAEIENGNAITVRATQSIEAVINGIGMLAESTRNISEKSRAQADAMEQIESGVEQISAVIQSNSAAAEQSSAVSEELSAQSENLNELVGQFVLRA